MENKNSATRLQQAVLKLEQLWRQQPAMPAAGAGESEHATGTQLHMLQQENDQLKQKHTQAKQRLQSLIDAARKGEF